MAEVLVNALYSLSRYELAAKTIVKVVGNLSVSEFFTDPLIVSDIRTAYGDAYTNIYLYRFRLQLPTFDPLTWWSQRADKVPGIILSKAPDLRPSMVSHDHIVGMLDDNAGNAVMAMLNAGKVEPFAVLSPNQELPDLEVELRVVEGDPEVLVISAGVTMTQWDQLDKSDQAFNQFLVYDSNWPQELPKMPAYYYSHDEMLILQEELQNFYMVNEGMTREESILQTFRTLRRNIAQLRDGSRLNLPRGFKTKLKQNETAIKSFITRQKRRLYDQRRKMQRGLKEMMDTELKTQRRLEAEALEEKLRLAQYSVLSPYVTCLQFKVKYVRDELWG